MFEGQKSLTLSSKSAIVHRTQTSAEFYFFPDTTELVIALKRIIQIPTLGLLAIISGFSTIGSPVVSNPVTPVSADTAETRTLTVKEHVEEYFADKPIMIDIARCESTFRQFDRNGEVLKNPKSTAIGVFQIMSSLHKETALKLGHDITTLEGQLGYADYLYEKQGARPWLASSHCWANYSEIASK